MSKMFSDLMPMLGSCGRLRQGSYLLFVPLFALLIIVWAKQLKQLLGRVADRGFDSRPGLP